jgi:hypothetical protein
MRNQAWELLDQYWRETRDEWFKLEVLQDYTGEDDSESLQMWYKDDKEDSLKSLKTNDPDPEFSRKCQEKLSQGVKLLRVRIVEEPITPYTQWEMEFYRLISQPLRGEKVFVIKKTAIKDLVIPKGDMIIFDEKRVAVNTYNKNGRAVSTNFYDRDEKVSDFIKLKYELQKRAEAL